MLFLDDKKLDDKKKMWNVERIDAKVICFIMKALS